MTYGAITVAVEALIRSNENERYVAVTKDLVRQIIKDIFEMLRNINRKSKKEVRLTLIPAGSGK